jgi:3-hydroxymyristoyl/3-hydroxydecanoyl-(acyl carrier protein) dehydratase
MPFPVLLEALLQPCGWLASYAGFAASRAEDVSFRNLDGKGAVLHGAVVPESGTLTVRATLDDFATAAGTTIVNFSIEGRTDAGLVLSLKTAFGFFSPSALASQTGLPTTAAMRDELRAASGRLASRAERARGKKTDRLHMIDQVTGYWPTGGSAGLGRIRGQQRVVPGAWYFKAHFYRDPVQPGSLGLHALLELASRLIRLTGLAATHDEILPLAFGDPFGWRFRGQVVPTNREVTTEVEVVSVEERQGERLVRMRGQVWVDDLRIYEMPAFSASVRRA